MNGIIKTKHFDQRFQQRGMNQIVVNALLQYGERWKSRHGVDSIVLTKGALADIKSDMGRSAFLACEKLRNAYIIVSEDGTLITVARSFRRTIH